jgi:hypothetical protein
VIIDYDHGYVHVILRKNNPTASLKMDTWKTKLEPPIRTCNFAKTRMKQHLLFWFCIFEPRNQITNLDITEFSRELLWPLIFSDSPIHKCLESGYKCALYDYWK